MVTIHYTILEGKKPVHGKRLYAIPLGMQNNPGDFSEQIIRRALAHGTFDNFTTPASKMLLWGDYAVIAGPAQITPAFVKRVMEDQKSLDLTPVAVSTTRFDDIEFHLPARHVPE